MSDTNDTKCNPLQDSPSLAGILNHSVSHTLSQTMIATEERCRKFHLFLTELSKDETPAQKKTREEQEARYREEARIRRELLDKARGEVQSLGVTLLCDSCQAHLNFTFNDGIASVERCDCRDDYDDE